MLKKFSKNVLENLKSEEIEYIRDLLIEFKKIYKIFISSMSNLNDIKETLEHKCLINFFDEIFGNESY